MKRILCLMTVLAVLFVLVPFGARAAGSDVYVSNSGSDSAAGTSAAPFKTLDKALTAVADGGTVHIVGTVTVDSWKSHSKTVTVTGGTLDFSSLSTVTLGDGVNFKATTLNFKSGATLYANGNRLSVAEDVTVNNIITVYGGANTAEVASTDVTLLAGSYTRIYGGGNSGKVTGDVYLTVGGKVNPNADPASHSATYSVYGGGNSGSIGGGAYLTFTGNAKANYIYGGNSTGGTISGGTHVLMSGGQSMSIYGGSAGTDHKGSVTLTITGGSVEQVFGGSGVGLTGDVSIHVLGGTITRRIYGGCYNEVSNTGSWQSSNYVAGNVTLAIGSNANITLNAKDSSGELYNDRSIYAHSRYNKPSTAENSAVIFAGSGAYNKYNSKLKAQDLIMRALMRESLLKETSAADNFYTFAYEINEGNKTITYNGGTATLSLDGTSFVCNGRQHRPAKLTYSADWAGGQLDIVYTNNVDVGTATATVYAGNVSVSVTFDITKASQSAPAPGKTDETIRGKNDGTITGLTTAMEYSTDGTNYTPVTEASMTVAPGTYYVRYAATALADASDPAAVTVGQGRMLKITFKAEGAADIVKEVSWNGTLTDIPAVPAKVGYDKTAPKWDVTNFSNIQADTVVNAVYTINTYKVTFVADGKTVSTATVEHGKDANVPNLPAKSGYTGEWSGNGKNITADTTITAVYTKLDAGKYTDITSGNFGGAMLDETIAHLRTVVPLTSAEATQVENGTDVSLRLSLTDISSSVTSQDKARINSKLNGFSVGVYLDGTMYKKVGSAAQSETGRLSGTVTVKLTLPNSLVNADSKVTRSYQVIRVSDGITQVLEAAVSGNTLRFDTDRFGTFAITYKDTTVAAQTPSGGGQQSPQPTDPPSGGGQQTPQPTDPPSGGGQQTPQPTDPPSGGGQQSPQPTDPPAETDPPVTTKPVQQPEQSGDTTQPTQTPGTETQPATAPSGTAEETTQPAQSVPESTAAGTPDGTTVPTSGQEETVPTTAGGSEPPAGQGDPIVYVIIALIAVVLVAAAVVAIILFKKMKEADKPAE